MNKKQDDDAHREVLAVGEYLRRKMAHVGLTAIELAKELDVHPQTIYNVTTGKRSVSSNLALRLANRFREPTSMWLTDFVEVSPFDGHASSDLPAVIEEQPASWSGDDGAYGILVDYQIEALLRDARGGVSITPFDPEQVEPASYDLKIGLIVRRGFRALSEADWELVLRWEYEHHTLNPEEAERIEAMLKSKADAVDYDRHASLAQAQSVIIIAREIVRFDKNYLAHVGGTSRNSMHGLLVNHGFQIDPGYRGAIFVSAINMSSEEIPLGTHDKIVSLGISRLRRQPKRAYQQGVKSSVERVAETLTGQLLKSFSFKAVGAEFKGQSDVWNASFVKPTLEQAQARAVSSILTALEAMPKQGSPEIGAVLNEALDCVTLDAADVKALIRLFAITDTQMIRNAERWFQQEDDKQTLLDTLRRLALDLPRSVIRLVE